MNSKDVLSSIRRVRRMERLYTMLTETQKLAASDPTATDGAEIKMASAVLSEYMTSGKWQHDFELDEQGLLPADMPRGVLSEDGLYDLLCALSEYGCATPAKRRRILALNGSPREGGNTSIALDEMRSVFDAEGIDMEIVRIGSMDIRGCVACHGCFSSGQCVFDDIVNELAVKFEAADGLVVASPVYYASANATLVACLDRLFYSTRFDKRMKVGASVVCARRSGCSTTFDELNKYFTISGMPVASSRYWNNIHGQTPGEAAGDTEGLETMRELAQNMAFLIKSIKLGRELFGLPQTARRSYTNFIR